MPTYRYVDRKSREVHLHAWAVVLVSHNERNCWFSHFFETRPEAEAFIAASKAPQHSCSLRLYQLVT